MKYFVWYERMLGSTNYCKLTTGPEGYFQYVNCDPNNNCRISNPVEYKYVHSLNELSRLHFKKTKSANTKFLNKLKSAKIGEHFDVFRTNKCSYGDRVNVLVLRRKSQAEKEKLDIAWKMYEKNQSYYKKTRALDDKIYRIGKQIL